MSDAYDLHVLNDLAAAVRGADGALQASVAELEAQARTLTGAASTADHSSMVEAAREALGGLFGGHRSDPQEGSAPGDRARTLEALLARFEAAMADERLSGPARDAVIRAFDPVKAARDAALQANAG